MLDPFLVYLETMSFYHIFIQPENISGSLSIHPLKILNVKIMSSIACVWHLVGA